MIQKITNLNGLKIAICQMEVIPGRPDLNANYMLHEIRLAAKRGVAIIAFPELGVPGYLLGDKWEDDSFVADVVYHNQRIIQATTDIDITVIFGSLHIDNLLRNEDGRLRKYNAAIIAFKGKSDAVAKTLQPNYRIFDDNRHFVSQRQLRDNDIQQGLPGKTEDYFNVYPVPTPQGEINLGLILCEDMWHADYSWNPTKTLVEQGAELVFDLSASPWTWQKNRKRHQVVKDLLAESPVPFVYVNNTGVQNNGKNVIVFDGSSTVYNAAGDIIEEVEPYLAGTQDFTFASEQKVAAVKASNDTEEMFMALEYAVTKTLYALPPHMRKVVVGLSGGIDSAVTLTLFARILGPENVTAINMPSRFNTAKTKNIARRIAENLGVEYQERPIQDIVNTICKATGTKEGTLSYENVQARARLEILAACSQDIGGVYCGNGNKVEFAFGYGTLHGDIAGFLCPLGDLVKREVYQVADHLNKLFGREIIPQECFDIVPSAELATNQVDPFDYGNLQERGYHDEMVRAFIEFRKNPEWFLQKYIDGTLEQELKLPAGKLKTLFPSTASFIADLEKKWTMLHIAYFKRIQCPPIPILTKRAFGYDLRESLLSAHLTSRYHELKKFALAQSAMTEGKRVVIYGGSFNPPCIHHRQIVEALAKQYDQVIILPCAASRSDKAVNQVSNEDRANMAKLAFAALPNTELDLSDVESGRYTPTYRLQEKYAAMFPHDQIWHAVGGDIISGGGKQASQIHTTWQHGAEIWQNLNYAIIARPGYDMPDSDLPPSSEVIRIPNLIGSGTDARGHITKGTLDNALLDAPVKEYIRQHALYQVTD